MKNIDRIQSTSKIALTVEEEEKLSFFIETFEEQCSRLLPDLNNKCAELLSHDHADVLLLDENTEDTVNREHMHERAPFATRYKIKDFQKNE